MRIPRYWARGEASGFDAAGKAVRIQAWGWSSTSLEEARSVGEQRAKIGACRLALRTTGGSQPQGGEYDQYLETPMREEIIETLREGGETIGIVTRNRYGALVLNAASVLFVDIDRNLPKAAGLVGGLKSVFSKSERETPILESHAEVIIRVVAWWYENRSYSFRLYATRAGLRLLFTNKLFDPLSEEVKQIFAELGTDALYQRLTLKQKSFRARLTPKPWRIGVSRPPHRFPYTSTSEVPASHTPELPHSDQRAVAAMDDWITLYDDASLGYHVCTLLEVFGNAEPANPVVDHIINAHDGKSCADETKPLA